MHLFKALLLGLALVASAHGRCKSTDAKWKKNQAPKITQPSRTDPKKLTVNWGSIIENQRCVDEWNLFIWQVTASLSFRFDVLNVKLLFSLGRD